MKKVWQWSFAGFFAGGLTGVVLLTINVVGSAFGGPSTHNQVAERALDVLHTPPLLVAPGETATLSYDIVCPPLSDPPGAPCSPKGSLHVRATGKSTFSEVPLERGENGLFSYSVPDSLTGGAGFEYYVTFEDGRGNSVSVPKGATAAPEHAWIVRSWTTVDIGTHQFGSTRAPDSVVAEAGWGQRGTDLGLNDGKEQSRIGPSGFDVGPGGTVVVLDQVNHRLSLYRSGRVADHLPITFRGGEGDVAVADDGTIWVLDDGGSQRPGPTVSAYSATGRPVTAAALAEEIGDMLRIGPSGPVVHSYPSEMWLPVASAQSGLGVAEQVREARPGRPVTGGRELVVRASPDEVRLALVAGNKVLAAWRILSTTTLGEVQLAEPSGSGMIAIVRVWTEDRAEFRVLQLGPSGLTAGFAVTPYEWAESAPLSRFRLKGNTLYHLRTSPAGAEVVAYEMGGTK